MPKQLKLLECFLGYAGPECTSPNYFHSAARTRCACNGAMTPDAWRLPASFAHNSFLQHFWPPNLSENRDTNFLQDTDSSVLRALWKDIMRKPQLWLFRHFRWYFLHVGRHGKTTLKNSSATASWEILSWLYFLVIFVRDPDLRPHYATDAHWVILGQPLSA